MDFLISSSFTEALTRLPTADQKAVKTSAFDLQTNPAHPGLQMHRIDRSKDPHFWSVRVNGDIRIIVHKTDDSLLLAYVDHHDRAYAWAERRRIEAHPKTGAIQIVEVRERVEDVAPRLPFTEPQDVVPAAVAPAPAIFSALSTEDLLGIGVPEDWLDDVQAATEERFFNLAKHLPAEAAEALLEYAAVGRLPVPASAPHADPFDHPDAKRRFRIVEDLAELEAALDAPWDRWAVFLHPSQRAMVERNYTGAARVAGSAGTGKTVVALHRAVNLARAADARVLLTTFSDPLARALDQKVRLLAGPHPAVVPRISVTAWDRLGLELFQLVRGFRPIVATSAHVESALARAAADLQITDIPARFLRSEWTHVVDAWQVADAEGYQEVPRLGRKNRLGSKQRSRLWPIFAATRAALEGKGVYTQARLLDEVTRHYSRQAEKPFNHIVVDEAQDLGVPELRLLAALMPSGQNPLFLGGDLGQRIFQQPFSWKALGVDVRGRSTVLKVNYRTSHQIRSAADRLLPAELRDVDGLIDERRGTISVFDGPEPEVRICETEDAECAVVGAQIVRSIADGVLAGEIGIFVRSVALLDRARQAAKAAGVSVSELATSHGSASDQLHIGAMHDAKGLEFRVVIVMGCDEDVLPLRERMEAAGDEVELEDIYETERQLLYVACTRARDRLIVTGVTPGSEFLEDLGNGRLSCETDRSLA